MHLDYDQQPPAHHFKVIGTKGSLQWNPWAEKKDWDAYPLRTWWERNVMFREEMRYFVVMARGEVGLSCSLDGGVRVWQLVDTLHRSSVESRKVDLIEDEND